MVLYTILAGLILLSFVGKICGDKCLKPKDWHDEYYCTCGSPNNDPHLVIQMENFSLQIRTTSRFFMHVEYIFKCFQNQNNFFSMSHLDMSIASQCFISALANVVMRHMS